MLKIYRNIFTILFFNLFASCLFRKLSRVCILYKLMIIQANPFKRVLPLFWMVKVRVLTHQNLFIGATSAKVFTQDSTVHNYFWTFNAHDPASGLVKFAVDNNLSTKFQKASIKAGKFEEGTSLTLMQATDIQKTEKKDVKTSKSAEIEGYGQCHCNSG